MTTTNDTTTIHDYSYSYEEIQATINRVEISGRLAQRFEWHVFDGGALLKAKLLCIQSMRPDKGMIVPLVHGGQKLSGVYRMVSLDDALDKK